MKGREESGKSQVRYWVDSRAPTRTRHAERQTRDQGGNQRIAFDSDHVLASQLKCVEMCLSTLQHILAGKEDAYHQMMQNTYYHLPNVLILIATFLICSTR